MSTDEIKQVISKLKKETPVKSIGLSGGEPLLREDLPEILSFLRDNDIDPLIITNGTLLTENTVSATMIGGTYEVTLLSHRREIHDKLAGRTGAWDCVVEGMANIRKAGGSLVMVFIATKLNYMDLYETAKLGIALGADVLIYNRINLGAHNIGYIDQLLPDPTMIQGNLDTLEEIAEKYHLAIGVSVVIEPCIVDIRKYKNIHFGWCPLAGDGSYFTIDPEGNIRVCNHSPVILGNIKRESFIDIYYNHPYLKSFREVIPDECQDCAPSLKEMCCGGCKAASEQCYGTLTKVDPFVTFWRENSQHDESGANRS
jgi:radical SAM protein with 4Fe4S-binding SPASM domain